MRADIELTGIREAADSIVELDNGGDYYRYAGKIINAPAEIIPGHECQIELLVQPPAALVANLRDVTVYSRCVLMTAQGQVIRESLINSEYGAPPLRWQEDGRLALEDAPPPAKFPVPLGKKIVLLKQLWDGNYGHWVVESLPRVAMIAEVYDLADCCFLVGAESGGIARVYRESLKLSGVPEQNILPAPDTGFMFDELIYPTPITYQPWVKAKRAITFLETFGTRVPDGVAHISRIYVARRPGEQRQLLNEPEIIARLVAAGYVVVTPGLLDFAVQVQIFRHAKFVVGILGAGLTNIVFAPKGLNLLALTSEYMQDDFFWDLTCHKEGRYISLHGKATDPGAGMQSDFTIDMAAFEDCFQAFDPS